MGNVENVEKVEKVEKVKMVEKVEMVQVVQEEDFIETADSEENTFNNAILLFPNDEDLSGESLIPFYHENLISSNNLFNGSVSHPEFDPIDGKSKSAGLSATIAVVFFSLCLPLNWRWSYIKHPLLISL